MGEYGEYGNYSGSMAMYMILFPDGFLLPAEMSAFSFISWLDNTGALAEVLRNAGQATQRSGRGQNNYRTNLLEAILSELGEHARYTQMLWRHITLFAIDDPTSWTLDQGAFIEICL